MTDTNLADILFKTNLIKTSDVVNLINENTILVTQIVFLPLHNYEKCFDTFCIK